MRGPLRLLGAAVFLLVSALVLVPAFELAGLHPHTGVHLETVGIWVFGAGIRVTVITLLAYASVRATAPWSSGDSSTRSASGSSLDALERAKRARTLGAAVSKVTTVFIVGIAVLMILREFQIDIAPVLTGAGIAGLAVGFGAQTLVRDVISGFFLLLEDQVRVGDVAAINGTAGLVEADQPPHDRAARQRGHGPRLSEWRDHDARQSDEGLLVLRDRSAGLVPGGYRTRHGDLREIGDTLQEDPAFGPFILAPLEIQGVDAFADWWMVMKMRIKTMPLKQWEVGRELRKRINRALETQGISIPQARRPNPLARGRRLSVACATSSKPVSAPSIPARS